MSALTSTAVLVSGWTGPTLRPSSPLTTISPSPRLLRLGRSSFSFCILLASSDDEDGIVRVAHTSSLLYSYPHHPIPLDGQCLAPTAFAFLPSATAPRLRRHLFLISFSIYWVFQALGKHPQGFFDYGFLHNIFHVSTRLRLLTTHPPFTPRLRLPSKPAFSRPKYVQRTAGQPSDRRRC